MKKKRKSESSESKGNNRSLRADAQRNIDALLEAAKKVFVTAGVDAPVRKIAEQAGVGVGTVYRHFPQRADLIAAVFRREIDACADAAPKLAKKHPPFEALSRWMQRFVDFVATKRGLATALHSCDPAYEMFPAYLEERLCPALQSLLDAAAEVGEVRTGIDAYELLLAAAGVCSVSGNPAVKVGANHAKRMVELLVDGLRYQK